MAREENLNEVNRVRVECGDEPIEDYELPIEHEPHWFQQQSELDDLSDDYYDEDGCPPGVDEMLLPNPKKSWIP